MNDAETMTVVRLLTVVALATNTVVFAYGLATLRRGIAFSEQWPVIVGWRWWILLGLTLETAGWTLHQTYWWVWQVAEATGATLASDWFDNHGSVIIPAHAMVVSGALMITAPIAYDLCGRWWPAVLGGALFIFAALGLGLVRIGGAV